MQLASQIDEPDYGTLLDDMFFDARQATSRSARFIAPRVEVELAFVLKASRCKARTSRVFDVLAATDYVTPAIEIIDARIEQFDRAHQGDAQGVRHHQRQRRQRRHRARRAAGATRTTSTCAGSAPCCCKNGVVEETGLAAGVQDHPAIGVAWLANKLAPWGEYAAGRRQSCWPARSPGPCQRQAGDIFDADYGPLGAVSFRFV